MASPRSGYTASWALLILAELCCPAWADSAATPEGSWISYGDSGDKPEAVIHIFREDGEMKGRITQLFDPPATICELCPGDKRGQPLKGLEILWGFQQGGGSWTGGHILDPESGDVYQARMTLSGNGSRLEVRGYIGLSLLGRSQSWLRSGPENSVDPHRAGSSAKTPLVGT